MLRFRQTHNTHKFWKQAQMSKLARFSSKISVCVCLCVYIYMCVHVCVWMCACVQGALQTKAGISRGLHKCLSNVNRHIGASN